MNYSRYKINFLWNLVIVIGIQMRNTLRCDRKRKKETKRKSTLSIGPRGKVVFARVRIYIFHCGGGCIETNFYVGQASLRFSKQATSFTPHLYGTIPHYRSTLIYTFTLSPFLRPIVGIVYDTIRLIISCLYATIDWTANCHAILHQQNSNGLHFDKVSSTNVRYYPFQPFFRVSRKTGFTGSPQRICPIHRVFLVLCGCSYD